MDQYQQFIHKSRYARWLPEQKRRETWAETVNRYVAFWVDRGQLDQKTSSKMFDAIEESMSSHAFKGYLKGNCLKYLWRYDYKGKQVEDLQKAGWYLRKLTAMVTEENS